MSGCGTPKFTTLSPAQFAQSLARRLIPVADSLRDLRVRFGLRPYRVRVMRTRWTGGQRGIGEEVVSAEMEILPTPLVQDLSALAEVVEPVGLLEVGSVSISEVSGRYTEEQLRGLDIDGTPPAADEQVWYEIEFPRSDGQKGERRRFFLGSTPNYAAARFEWTFRLDRSHEGRSRAGELR